MTGVIAEKKQLSQGKKPHMKKSGEMPITRNRTSGLTGDKNSYNIT